MQKLNKKGLLDLALLVGLVAILLVPGWRLAVASWLQSGLLATGLFEPSPQVLEIALSESDYSMTLEDKEGRKVNLHQWQEKTLFINFWATWCAPCIAEMPGISQLYTKMKEDPNIDFLIISVDDDWQKARQFTIDKGYQLPIYRVVDGIPPILFSKSIPATFVIAPDGKVVMKQLGMANYNKSEFQEFLKSLNVNHPESTNSQKHNRYTF